MVREDIIRMAREAQSMTCDDLDRLWFLAVEESIKDGEMVARYHFAALVAAAEREACAQILDHNANACANNSILRDVLQGNATAIRARRSND